MLLGSCVSFNSVRVNPERAETTPYATEIEAHARTIEVEEAHMNPQLAIEHAKQLCPLYIPPKLPPVPEVPMDAVSKVQKDDDVALDQISLRQIGQLRQYILDAQTANHRSYAQYLKKCANMITPPAAP